MFLLTDELLRTGLRLARNLVIQEENIRRNFERFAPFAATERVLVAVTQAGASRQEIHEVLRQLSLQAWDVIRKTGDNPLVELICHEARLLKVLSEAQLRELLSVERYIGDAPQRSKRLVTTIRKEVDTARVDIVRKSHL
jgi:adenylosuccinate lyase